MCKKRKLQAKKPMIELEVKTDIKETQETAFALHDCIRFIRIKMAEFYWLEKPFSRIKTFINSMPDPLYAQ